MDGFSFSPLEWLHEETITIMGVDAVTTVHQIHLMGLPSKRMIGTGRQLVRPQQNLLPGWARKVLWTRPRACRHES